MKNKVCAHCGRGMGLVSYRWFRWKKLGTLNFCTRVHRELFKRKLNQDEASNQRWFAFLYPKT